MDSSSRLRQRRPIAGEWYHRGALRDSLVRKIRSRFEVDTRALAALRVALGSVILIDLFHRAADLRLYYTDEGVYPLAAYEAASTRSVGVSLHAASGEVWFQQFLFVLAGLFALALVVGYRTRLVAVVSFVLLVSLHTRNPAVLNGADRLLRVLLLLALLTPLGERWSIDVLRRGTARTTVVGFATAALLVQPLVVFSQNAVFKHSGDTWYTGDALEIAFANDAMTIFLGEVLRDYPSVLWALTWVWVTLLAGSVAFLLLTDGRLRSVIALAYIGVFVGMLATMAVGLFPLVLSAAVLPYLATPLWESAGRLLPRSLAGRQPTASRLGPLGRPPLEVRLLDFLRSRGHESTASFVVASGRSLLSAVGLIALVWVLLFGVAHGAGYDLPDAVDASALDQQEWGLFAPDPPSSYTLYDVDAELASGSTVGAFGGENATADRLPSASQGFDSFRERKFMGSVRISGRSDTSDVVAGSYADWACEWADEAHDDEVVGVTVYRIHQPISVDGEPEAASVFTVVERDCD